MSLFLTHLVNLSGTVVVVIVQSKEPVQVSVSIRMNRNLSKDILSSSTETSLFSLKNIPVIRESFLCINKEREKCRLLLLVMPLQTLFQKTAKNP